MRSDVCDKRCQIIGKYLGCRVVLHSIALKINASLHAIMVGKQARGETCIIPKEQGGTYPTLFFCPCPAFPTTCFAFVVAFSLPPVSPVALARVPEPLLQSPPPAFNLLPSPHYSA